MRLFIMNGTTPPATMAARPSTSPKAVCRIAICSFSMICLILMASTTVSYGGNFHNALSLQGFTGLLNTPNAEVTDEGKFYALYSNQRESQFPFRNLREESYIFSVGLFSFAELGGRLTDATKTGPHGNLGDLSANLKLKVPFIPTGYYLPDVAFGMQDAGGGEKHLQTKYLVATEEWWRLRLSLGYGLGPNRMNGIFGGAEFRAFDWLYLIGENDAQETNVGARLVTPEICGFPVNLQVTAKTSLNHQPGNMEFGFGLQFPLGRDHHNVAPLPERRSAAKSSSPASEPGVAAGPTRAEGSAESDSATSGVFAGTEGAPAAGKGDDRRLTQLLERLTDDGFQNVQVGTRGDALLVVEYENSRYNHNELDGLGVVIGTVADTIPSGYETLRLIIRKKGLRVLQLSAPLAEFSMFLRNPEKYGELNEQLAITPDVTDDGAVSFVPGSANPSWLRSALVVYPGLKTFVGTEVGLFNYLLSAKLDYSLNTWKGAILNARWDIPVSWNENFDEGKAFRSSRNDSQIERLMLFQALKPLPELMINLGAGMVLHDAYGTLNELLWTPGSGTHRFSLRQAYVSKGGSQAQTNEVYLGSYRYYAAPLDLYLTVTGGRFFDNDTGVTVEMKRFFGDTALSVFYKNSRTAASENVQVGGVQVSFPLTPRRDMKPYPLQLKGSDEWSYAQETKIVAPGSKNFVSTSIGVNPQPPFNLERVFFNRDRLSEAYIRKHLLRLRDAYITYRR